MTEADFPVAVGEGKFSYSRRPTFTFTPQRGREFSQKLVNAVDLEILAALIAADWDVNLLFRILVRGLNDLENELGLPIRNFTKRVNHIGALQSLTA